MHTNFEVTVSYNVAPLKLEKTFLVETIDDVNALRDEGKAIGRFTLTSYRIVNVLRSDEVARAVGREILESERAMNGWTKETISRATTGSATHWGPEHA